MTKKSKYITRKVIREQLLNKYTPFDHVKFFDENTELVMKFIKKRTLRLVVNEEIEIPEELQYRNEASVLSVSGDKKLERNSLEKLEWIKCALDPIYYCKKYIKITTVDGGISNFTLFKYQEDMINMFEDNRFTIACLARQLGKTTVVSAYVMWFAHFHSTKQSAILANKADQAQEIMERIQQSYELLPLFLKPSVRVFNKRSMTFRNKAKIFSGASSRSSIRGKSISLVYWDEAAHTPNDWDFYESIYPTISSGKETKLILTSTPNGKRGVFYKLWSDENSGFAKIEAIWSDNPYRDEKWKEETIAATSPEQFAQEFENVFRGSSHSLISTTVMTELMHSDPIKVKDSGLKIYEDPVKDHLYFMGVDTSRGLGGDYHAFTVVDITDKNNYKVVARFKNNLMSSLLYPNLIFNVARSYNASLVLVELNDLGEQVGNILYNDLEYDNLLMSCKDEKSKRQTIGFGHNARPGIVTSKSIKSVGCNVLKTLVETKRLTLNDLDIIDELGNFVPKGSSYAAEEGANDDLVMTLVLFAWASAQPYFIDLTNIDVRKQLLDNQTEEMLANIAPFGIIDNDFISDPDERYINNDPDLLADFMSSLD